MESIGTRLKHRRESKKLSLETVYKKTKIHPDILEALEEDRFNILSPIYIKGFLKTYSSFLGLDPHEILNEYNVQDLSEASGEPAPPSKTSPRRIRLKINSRLISPKVLSVIVLVVLSFIFAARIKKKPQPVKQPVQARESDNIQTKQKQSLGPQKQTIVKQPKVSPLRLGLRAKENCWVRVRLDGKLVFRGTLRKGQSESWQAKEKIELSIGNARAIELEVNGKILAPLGRRKEAIRNILITPEGVSIKK